MSKLWEIGTEDWNEGGHFFPLQYSIDSPFVEHVALYTKEADVKRALLEHEACVDMSNEEVGEGLILASKHLALLDSATSTDIENMEYVNTQAERKVL